MEGFAEAQKILANSNEKMTYRYTVAYAGFSKGGEGGRKFRKVEIIEDQDENFPAQNQFCFPAQT